LITVYLEGVGIAGPGLDGWANASLVLSGVAAYEPVPFVPRPVALLPPAERRRAGGAVRLAIGVASEALAHADRDPQTMAMVFTSSGGDGDTVHEILCVLATEAREVSPTRFHNSVHNAPAGYWAVAAGSCEPSTSLCAYDASFAAGLMDAAAQATVDDRPVTLVAYDLPYPEPLHGVRPIVDLAGLALVLTPSPTERSIARLLLTSGVSVTSGSPGMLPTPLADERLERLRSGNPAARGLPLLAALARGRTETIWLEETGGTRAEIRVEPC
jgi:Beta-ketoacyl synthase, N-terminal domain